ncbi:MAG TPA: DUF3426 domain-containing protein [Stellaceae bacterium]|nr:DUF3426 domain-containing protein [Stellaceae bacterium]
MILTCPACSVRYVVDPRALGVKGRTVRCARCSHTWYQAPPDEEQPPAAVAPTPAAATAAAAATIIEKPEPPPAEPAPERRERAPAPSREERIQLPAVARPKRNWEPILATLAAVIILIAGLAAAAIIERDHIARLYPASADLFARVGFPVSDIGIGLDVRANKPVLDMANGLPTLVIDGNVVNVSSVARKVPKLVVMLLDQSDHDLQDVTVAASTDRLLPGESATFKTSITQPPEAAHHVMVVFAGARG